MQRNQIHARTNPSAPINQKPLFHPATWVNHPRMGAKIRNAKYCDELKIAEARPRSLEGNQEATIRPFPGKTGAWAKPATRRRTKMVAKAAPAPRKPAKPFSSAHTDQTTRPMP